MPINPNSVTKRFDLTTPADSGTSYQYIGEAPRAVAASTASWRIKRLTYADAFLVMIDTTGPSAIWNNRASETYT